MSQIIIHPKYDQSHLDLIYEHAKQSINKKIHAMSFKNKSGIIIGEATGCLKSNSDGHLFLYIEPVAEINYEIKGDDSVHLTGTFDDGLEFDPIPIIVTTILQTEKPILHLLNNVKDQYVTLDGITINSTGEDSTYSRLTLTTLDKPKTSYNAHNMGDDVLFALKSNFPTLYSIFTIGGVNYEVRSKNNFEYLRTTSEQDSPEIQDRFEHALLLAISFAVGKKIRVQAVHETGVVNKTTLYRVIGYDTNTVCSPLLLSIGDNKDYVMIDALQTFFFQQNSKELEGILELFLLSPIPYETGIRTLLVCTLLEGLISILSKLPKNKEFSGAKKVLIEHLQTAPIEGISETVLPHFIKILATSQPYSLLERLDYLASTYKVPIDDRERVAFRDVRNSLAHGTFLHPYNGAKDEAGKMHDNFCFVSNIFNKIILCAANYKGDYTDFSKEKYWCEVRNLGLKISDKFVT